LDVLIVFIVYDLIETAVLAKTCQFFERGFMVKGGLFLTWH
jgi:hypothetical protein